MCGAQQLHWLKGKNLGNNLAHQVIDNCAAADSESYYLAGYTWQTQLLSGAVIANGPTNGFVIKLNEHGDTLWTWTTTSNATASGDGTYIRAICNSPNNTVTVGGYYSIFSGTSTIAGQTVSGSGAFIVRLSSVGQVQMVKTYSGVKIYDLDADVQGNYYFAGNSQTMVVFGNDTLSAPGGGNWVDYLGSSKSNGDPKWIKQLGFINFNNTTAGNEAGQHRLTVCNTNPPYIITAGFFVGTYAFANQNLSSNGSDDALLIKFDTSGNYKSHYTFGGTNTESFHDIRSNKNGRFVVGGTYKGSTTINSVNYSTGGVFYQSFLIQFDTALTIKYQDTCGLSGWFPKVAIDEYNRSALAVFVGNNWRFLWVLNDTGARIFTKTLSYTSGTTSFASMNPLGLAFSKKSDNTLYFGAVFKPDATVDTFNINSTQSHNFDIAAGKFSIPPMCNANLGPDTGYCGSFQRTLTTGLMQPLDSILWSTGDTSQSIQVNQPGTYWVYTKLGSCQHMDSVVITQNNSLPSFDELNDTILCNPNGFNLQVPQNNALGFRWSNNSISPTVYVPYNRT
ncbi:MAG: hypothetical protein LPK48_02485, partial [Bacteroidota bacterium]|nr:hypothetical protein [Bacteroidota bacterium]